MENQSPLAAGAQRPIGRTDRGPSTNRVRLIQYILQPVHSVVLWICSVAEQYKRAASQPGIYSSPQLLLVLFHESLSSLFLTLDFQTAQCRHCRRRRWWTLCCCCTPMRQQYRFVMAPRNRGRPIRQPPPHPSPMADTKRRVSSLV